MQWSFTSTKSLVCHSKKLQPLSQFITEKKASSVARHADKFPAGSSLSVLKPPAKPMRLHITDEIGSAILKHCGEQGTAHVGVAWVCGLKHPEGEKSVIPTGAALDITKQVIIPADGEVRI